MAAPEQPSADLKLPPERPAFAGLLMRLLAFGIDCVLLFFVFNGLARAARPALVQLNPWLPWLSWPVLFLYFWLLNGPLSKGQTLGKALAGIQVVGRDGRPIGWGAAARRALLQVPVFTITLLLVNFMAALLGRYIFPDHSDYLMGFPIGAWLGLNITLFIISLEGLALLIMLIFGIVMHPWKRGWHDLWAGAFVVPAPPPPAFRAAMDTEPDVITARKLANHVRITVIYGIILGVFFMAQPLLHLLRGGGDRAKTAEMVALHNSASTPQYLLMSVAVPSVQLRESILQRIRFVREQARRAGQTVPTTETLRRQMLIDEHTIYAEYARQRGAYSVADLNDPELRAAVERLRADLWRQWQKEHGQGMGTITTTTTSTAVGSTPSTTFTSSMASIPANPNTSATLEARNFSALLFEPLALVLYNGRQLKGRIHGPADPARGALTFEDVPSPIPQAADQPTTATAAPTPLPARETPGP